MSSPSTRGSNSDRAPATTASAVIGELHDPKLPVCLLATAASCTPLVTTIVRRHGGAGKGQLSVRFESLADICCGACWHIVAINYLNNSIRFGLRCNFVAFASWTTLAHFASSLLRATNRGDVAWRGEYVAWLWGGGGYCWWHHRRARGSRSSVSPATPQNSFATDSPLKADFLIARRG